MIEAAKTKLFGCIRFYPGPGLGGHCIPIDPFYLTWKLREYDISTRFVELAGEVNAAMPRYVIERLATGLNDRFACGLKGSRILVLRVAYKKNVDDVRGSATFKVIRLLKQRGAEVPYLDPHVSSLKVTREWGPGSFWHGVDFLGPGQTLGLTAAVILTDHDAVDYQTLVRELPLVVDSRNVTAAIA